MSEGCILVVDDEPLMRDFLKEVLERKSFQIDLAADGKQAISKITSGSYDLTLTDLKMPGADGMEVLHAAKEISPSTDVIIVTAYGTINNAVEAMKDGARDYVTKPFSADEIEVRVSKIFELRKLIDENRYLRSELRGKYRFDNIIVGTSPKIQEVFETIEVAASTRATILIQGESGTGKEVIAKAIHYNSNRRDNPFIKINCAALPEGLVESELFGHEKGAFTGAIRQTKGKFEMAHGGTLLLDEVSEITPSLQGKLLRVLQEREFERVGGEKSVSVDVRIIATSNRDLNQEIEAGRFREDLFYRLNVIPLFPVSLRERKEDIPLLAEFFMNKYSKENGKRINGLSDEALDLLLEMDWPGNIRELENSIERAVMMSKVEILTPKDFRFERTRPASHNGNKFNLTGKTLKEVEQTLILETLKEQNSHKDKTSEVLGISVRTLRNKLNEYRQLGTYND